MNPYCLGSECVNKRKKCVATLKGNSQSCKPCIDGRRRCDAKDTILKMRGKEGPISAEMIESEDETPQDDSAQAIALRKSVRDKRKRDVTSPVPITRPEQKKLRIDLTTTAENTDADEPVPTDDPAVEDLNVDTRAKRGKQLADDPPEEDLDANVRTKRGKKQSKKEEEIAEQLVHAVREKCIQWMNANCISAPHLGVAVQIQRSAAFQSSRRLRIQRDILSDELAELRKRTVLTSRAIDVLDEEIKIADVASRTMAQLAPGMPASDGPPHQPLDAVALVNMWNDFAVEHPAVRGFYTLGAPMPRHLFIPSGGAPSEPNVENMLGGDADGEGHADGTADEAGNGYAENVETFGVSTLT